MKLEVIAKQRAEGRPDIGELTQRQKAHDIIRCLKELKYLGLQPHRPYRDIRNNYAGVALESTEHSSLPLISVSIVVAVAARFGLKVHFVAVLSHVFAGVDIHDHNKPGGPLSSKPHDRAYFDPFSDYKEYPLDSILNNLNEQGLEIGTDPELPHHLRITNTLEIVQRAKRNIHYVSAPGVMPSSFDVPRASIYGPQAIDRQLAQYSTAWASYHFSPTGRAWQILIEQYQKSFPGDRQLINKYLCDERCSRLTAAQQEDCRRILEETRKKNEEPSKVKPRDRLTAGTVKYFVGQCFQHRTQGFIGAIVGWDEYDDHDPNRNQGSFYFCL